MKKLTFSALSLTIVCVLALAIIAQTEKRNSDQQASDQAKFKSAQQQRIAEIERQKQKEAEFKAILEASPAAATLEEQRQKNGSEAILEAVESGDKSLVPYLKWLDSEGVDKADLALARLGLEEYKQKVVKKNKAIEQQFRAQLVREEQERIELERILSQSPAAQILDKLRGAKPNAILEAGKSGDKSLVPYLKHLAKKGDANAEVALVWLGEDEYLQEMIRRATAIEGELDADDYIYQDRAIQKLVRVGTKEAYRVLYKLLDDTAPRLDPDPRSHSLYGTRSSRVISYLEDAMPNRPDTQGVSQEKKVELWKAWFEANNLID